jgi:hypothetical protein
MVEALARYYRKVRVLLCCKQGAAALSTRAVRWHYTLDVGCDDRLVGYTQRSHIQTESEVLSLCAVK